MKILLFNVSLWFLMSYQNMNAQQQIIWLNYIQDIRFSHRWSLTSDVQIRFPWTDDLSLLALRTNLLCAFNNNISVGAGGSFFRSYIGDWWVPEWRPHLELNGNFKTTEKFSFLIRIRTEERLVRRTHFEGTHNYYSWRHHTRVRNRLEVQHKLNERFVISLGNEFFFHPLPNKQPTFMDHNRLYAGVAFKLSNEFTVQGMYMLFTRHDDELYTDSFVYRINLRHTISLHTNEAGNS